MRHLLNATELALYASVSCGFAFLTRLLPAFFWPVLLLRLGVFAYCLVVIAKAEGQRELAVVIASAVFIGLCGGYFDYLEILLRYDLPAVVSKVTALVCFASMGSLLYFQFKR